MDFEGKEKTEYVKDVFDSIAGGYDRMNSLMSLGMDRLWRKKAVRLARAGDGMRFLDVCCGTGKLTLELGKAVSPSGQVTGLDSSGEMLTAAREKIAKSPQKKIIKLVQGDATRLPFLADSFDGATIGWGLRNLPDARQGLLEMIRVVKPGSMIVSIDMGKPESPIIQRAYWPVMANFVPFLGRIWGKAKEYTYLYQSASKFSSQKELTELFRNCGLLHTGHINLWGGALAIVYGQKPYQ